MKPSLPTAATIAIVAAVFACTTQSADNSRGADASKSAAKAIAVQPESGERRFGAIRQLTFGGENAEAYFSRDGKRLIFQSTRGSRPCDQQFVMNVDGSGVRRVSTGFGKTTCGYFFDADRRIFFASTHAA